MDPVQLASSDLDLHCLHQHCSGSTLFGSTLFLKEDIYALKFQTMHVCFYKVIAHRDNKR